MRQFVMIFSLITLLTGCTSVVNKLTTEPFKPDPAGRTLGADIDDTKMATLIGVNLKKAGPELKIAHINISVFNGLVLLTGEVPSADVEDPGW